MKTLIVIPAYNESRNIGPVLQALTDEVLDHDVDVLVVNDGSTDDTEAVARSYPVMVVSHPCNFGYGAALQTGFRFAAMAGYDFVVQFDADGQHNPRDITVIREALTATGADLVIGSRFLGDPNFRPGSAKSLAIRFFRAVIRLITGRYILDPTSGLRGLSHRSFVYYAGFNRFPADFPDADIVIDVLLRHWQVMEVPVGNHSRAYGKSMHSGMKPLVYMCKVLLCIFVVVLDHVRERGVMRT